MLTTAELLDKAAREAERLKNILIAEECLKEGLDLEEFIKRMKALLADKY